jgi:hypothetical protein
MFGTVAWIDGWEIRPRPDGGFGVYDEHGLVEGPFGTKQEALMAASALPKRSPIVKRKLSAHGEEAPK